MACNVSASAKLECRVVRVVLEADGTEIDGDDELLSVHDSVLMALQQDEHWTPATVSEPSLSVASDDVSMETTSPAPGKLHVIGTITCDDMNRRIMRLYVHIKSSECFTNEAVQ